MFEKEMLRGIFGPKKHEVKTRWSKVLPEKLTVAQLVKTFPAFYGNRRYA
jgi:hypothetical protein